ncbi:unnamed protein product [Heligmosomoides polygyrus]|uniref:Ribosomal_L18e/L15P domain-containing protein n=1 Tax=Heligmosomoides polygyrus TaxID=6339 RepID=A0A183G2D2_HELPZ|nr:unnamed protein product [Heligmosomoides polygyrus]
MSSGRQILKEDVLSTQRYQIMITSGGGDLGREGARTVQRAKELLRTATVVVQREPMKNRVAVGKHNPAGELCRHDGPRHTTTTTTSEIRTPRAACLNKGRTLLFYITEFVKRFYDKREAKYFCDVLLHLRMLNSMA